MISPPVPTLYSLRGLWTRSLIAWPDGRRDVETEVHWLQGPGFYIDLRQPAAKPDFSGCRGFHDLDRHALEWLARQEGFAGRLRFDGEFFEWGRTIDLQPVAMYSDAGRLWLETGRMVEEGRDIPYTEHWHSHDGRPAERCFAARLRHHADGRDGFVVRADAHFMFARARAKSLPDARSLVDCLALATSAQECFDWLDCEISYGIARGRDFEIHRSSLPWREGCQGAIARAGDLLRFSEGGNPHGSEWQIVEAEGDSALLDA